MSHNIEVFALAMSGCVLAAVAHGQPVVNSASPAVAILEANRAATAVAGSPAAARIVYAFDGAGLKGKATAYVDLRDGRFVDALDAGPATGMEGYDGVHAWEKDISGTVTLQDGGDQRALAVNDAYRRANAWWRADRGGATIEALGPRQDAGMNLVGVAVSPPGGERFEAWFDAASHQLARVVEKQGPQTIVTSYADYRPVAGRLIPWRTTIDDGEGAKYVQTLTVTSVTFEPAPASGAFTAPTVQVADFAIDGGAGRTVIPFELINNHVYGWASVNGKGPFRFIFNTGGVDLVTPTLAGTLGLTAQGNFDGHGAGEGVTETGFTKVGELKLGEARLKDQTFFVLPLDDLSDVEGVDEQGMVGFETFRRFVTRFDYGAHTVTLIDPKAFDPSDAGTPIHFDFADHNPEISGAFEGIPGKFRIDTGSRSEVTLNRPFVERNGLRASHPKGVDAVDGWGVGGPSRSYVMRGASLKLGPVEVRDVVASAATQAKGAFAGDDYQGNIGGGILKRFVVTFDYGHQVMYLKPVAGSLADVGDFDRAGMWINRGPGGFKVVDVTAAGPADAAGVKVGDIITEVEGHAAPTLTVHEVRRRLRTAAPGTTIPLTVSRDGATARLTITLRDLI
jgi:hypothetical protein